MYDMNVRMSWKTVMEENMEALEKGEVVEVPIRRTTDYIGLRVAAERVGMKASKRGDKVLLSQGKIESGVYSNVIKLDMRVDIPMTKVTKLDKEKIKELITETGRESLIRLKAEYKEWISVHDVSIMFSNMTKMVWWLNHNGLLHGYKMVWELEQEECDEIQTSYLSRLGDEPDHLDATLRFIASLSDVKIWQKRWTERGDISQLDHLNAKDFKSIRGAL